MKILFTADLHYKLGQKSVPLEWATNRFLKMNDAIVSTACNNDCDLVIIGGDLFDKHPSVEELDLYWHLVIALANADLPVVIYSGNHEASSKTTTFLASLRKASCAIHKDLVILDYFSHTSEIDFIPYNKLKEFEKSGFPFPHKSKILCSHFRGEIPPHVKPEIDLSLFDDWKLVLAGDLHSYSNSQRNILYPGSPVTTSFHRNLVETGVLVVDTDTLEHSWVKLDLPQLLRKTIKAGEIPVPGDYHHIMYEVEGDISELSQLEDSQLIDKKVTVRAQEDVSLILDPSMSIRQEVQEYLEYVLLIPPEKVTKVLTEFSKYE